MSRSRRALHGAALAVGALATLGYAAGLPWPLLVLGTLALLLGSIGLHIASAAIPVAAVAAAARASDRDTPVSSAMTRARGRRPHDAARSRGADATAVPSRKQIPARARGDPSLAYGRVVARLRSSCALTYAARVVT